MYEVGAFHAIYNKPNKAIDCNVDIIKKAWNDWVISRPIIENNNNKIPN